MKNGIDAVGIDANPSSCFSARVKTNWGLKGSRLVDLLDDVDKRQRLRFPSTRKYLTHPTYLYLESTGMLERGWISTRPLRKAIAIKSSIDSLPTSSAYKNALTLALIAEVVDGASNVKFGPELYCAKKRRDAGVYSGFEGRVLEMAADLDKVAVLNPGMVETEGFHAAGIAESDFRKQVEATTPLGRIGQPQDIAAAAVFLASADSAWITGETLVIAGGYR